MSHPYLVFALAQLEMHDGPKIQDALLIAGELLTQRFRRSFHSDLVPEVRDVVLDDVELDAVHSALMRWIDRHPDHAAVTSAFWALSKSSDPSIRPFLDQSLDRYLQQVSSLMQPIGQILVALNNLGADTISGASYSSDDHPKNLRDALDYRKR